MSWLALQEEVAAEFAELRGNTLARYEQRCYNYYQWRKRRRAERARERTQVARLYRWRWKFERAPLAHVCSECGEPYGSEYALSCHRNQRRACRQRKSA